ncbi:ImmA/IrrE family metallo-endopeptidase, partial [bacterium]|nr:ImmA/IrrE family metallo-endopeptidase [bacterium]
MTPFIRAAAQRYDVPVKISSVVEGRRAFLLGTTIYLNADLPEERANWAFCHELAHLLLKHHERMPRDTVEEEAQERAANFLASDLILPEEEFKPLMHLSLEELKQRFSHASYEVIARRRLKFRPGLLTIVDDVKISARLAPDGWNRPMQLFPPESQALDRCLQEKNELVLQEEGMTVEATYIDEGRGVVRVIL